MSLASSPPTRCYVVFEGGGAKGYAHVGVLRALEKENLDIRGFAGTSAGAIMACLCAAGYRADELIRVKPDGGIHHLLAELGYTDTLALLGKGRKEILALAAAPGWYELHKHHRKIGEYKPEHCNAFERWRVSFSEKIGIQNAWKKPRDPNPFLKLISLAQRAGTLSLGAIRNRLLDAKWYGSGQSTTDGLRDALSKALAQKNIAPEATFSEWHTNDGRSLPRVRVVVADITRGRMVLCSAETTPDVRVVDAVCASAAIPFLFEPVRLPLPDVDKDGAATTSNSLCVDGGINSNLPGWAFDAERAIDREAQTILAEIEDEGWPAVKPGYRNIIKPLLLTTVFGTKSLGLRNIGPNKRITLNPKLDLVEFAPAKEKLCEELENARGIAELAFKDEREFTDFMDVACDTLKLLLEAKNIKPGRIRQALATSNTDDPALAEYSDGLVQLRYCVGYDRDPDFRATLSYERSLVGEIIRREDAAVFSKFDLMKGGAYLQWPVDARVLSQQRLDLTWWIIVPFDLSRLPFGLPYRKVGLVFDSNEPFEDERRDEYVYVAEAIKKSIAEAISSYAAANVNG